MHPQFDVVSCALFTSILRIGEQATYDDFHWEGRAYQIADVPEAHKKHVTVKDFAQSKCISACKDQSHDLSQELAKLINQETTQRYCQHLDKIHKEPESSCNDHNKNCLCLADISTHYLDSIIFRGAEKTHHSIQFGDQTYRVETKDNTTASTRTVKMIEDNSEDIPLTRLDLRFSASAQKTTKTNNYKKLVNNPLTRKWENFFDTELNPIRKSLIGERKQTKEKNDLLALKISEHTEMCTDISALVKKRTDELQQLLITGNQQITELKTKISKVIDEFKQQTDSIKTTTEKEFNEHNEIVSGVISKTVEIIESLESLANKTSSFYDELHEEISDLTESLETLEEQSEQLKRECLTDEQVPYLQSAPLGVLINSTEHLESITTENTELLALDAQIKQTRLSLNDLDASEALTSQLYEKVADEHQKIRACIKNMNEQEIFKNKITERVMSTTSIMSEYLLHTLTAENRTESSLSDDTESDNSSTDPVNLLSISVNSSEDKSVNIIKAGSVNYLINHIESISNTLTYYKQGTNNNVTCPITHEPLDEMSVKVKINSEWIAYSKAGLINKLTNQSDKNPEINERIPVDDIREIVSQ